MPLAPYVAAAAFVILIVGFVAGCAWFVTRGDVSAPIVGECWCSAQLTADEVHTVVEHAVDDRRFGIVEGGTAMAAEFCPDHCPGGCVRGCVDMPRKAGAS